jgi:hypothetical protein
MVKWKVEISMGSHGKTLKAQKLVTCRRPALWPIGSGWRDLWGFMAEGARPLHRVSGHVRGHGLQPNECARTYLDLSVCALISMPDVADRYAIAHGGSGVATTPLAGITYGS